MKDNTCFPHILETHLVGHCNLNCKGCSHFAPLATGEVFTDIEIFKRDFSRLKQLFSDVYEIRLMGGEPLLHPDLVAFCKLTRDIFPKAIVSIFTNGKLLLNMPDVFWETCSKRNILIKITLYPIDLDIEAIRRKGEEFNVSIKIPKLIKNFFKTLNIDGNSDPNRSFSNCRHIYTAFFIGNGKLYPCALPPHIHLFSKYFNKKIHASKGDYINILEDVSPADVIDFANHPIPMCRWCISRRPLSRWGRSDRDIDEWTGFDAHRVPHFLRINKYRAISFCQKVKRSSRLRPF